ncbi:MAG: hypothetical protein H6918_06080 [Sphingomonadaceae bacterium]|nr:hypothetical protein [Sphingomonadaceae bacterium]
MDKFVAWIRVYLIFPFLRRWIEYGDQPFELEISESNCKLSGIKKYTPKYSNYKYHPPISISEHQNNIKQPNSEKFIEFLIGLNEDKSGEFLFILHFDIIGNFCGILSFGPGQEDGIRIKASDIFSYAFDRRVWSILVVHTHPAGDPTPSQQDMKATLQLDEAARRLNCRLYDHIIVGEKSIFSIRSGETYEA